MENLRQWSNEVFGNISKRKNVLLVGIKGAQKVIATHWNAFLDKLEKSLHKDMRSSRLRRTSLALKINNTMT